MAKRKDSLALFEVFGKKPQMPAGIAIPPGTASATSAGVTQAPPETAVASPAQSIAAGSVEPPAASGVEPPAERKVESLATSAVESPETPAQPQPDEYVPPPPLPDAPPQETPPVAEPKAQWSAKQLSVTMSQVQWAMTGGAAVLLLVCAFVLGRVSVPKPQGVPAIGPDPAGSTAGLKNDKPAGPTVAPVKRIIGKYYLVIQSIEPKDDKHYADAEAIVDFLKNNGVYADIRESANGKGYLVWSSDAMDSYKDQKALAYVKKIEDLGKKYLPKGRYDFNQKGEPFFIKATSE